MQQLRSLPDGLPTRTDWQSTVVRMSDQLRVGNWVELGEKLRFFAVVLRLRSRRYTACSKPASPRDECHCSKAQAQQRSGPGFWYRRYRRGQRG